MLHGPLVTQKRGSRTESHQLPAAGPHAAVSVSRSKRYRSAAVARMSDMLRPYFQEAPMKRLAIAALIAVSAFPVLHAQQAVPEIPFDSVPNFFKLPADLNFGEDAG